MSNPLADAGLNAAVPGQAPLRLRALRWILVVLLIGMAASAQARWYQVEVVVFRHAGGADNIDEQWPPLDALPDFTDSIELRPGQPAAGDAAAEPVAFQPLPRAEMRLDGVANRLRAGAYELLLAGAWRQPSFGVVGARRVYLSDLDAARRSAIPVGPGGVVGRATPDVEGTVSIKVARLLHVAVDFLFMHDGQPVRLAETRQVKLRETHYFDHPLFGVVVQVSPYAIPDIAATQQVGADEPEDPEAAAADAPPIAD